MQVWRQIMIVGMKFLVLHIYTHTHNLSSDSHQSLSADDLLFSPSGPLHFHNVSDFMFKLSQFQEKRTKIKMQTTTKEGICN